MELARLIEGLSDVSAYPYPVDKIEIRHTHISVVFLAGPYVYKVKKPVYMGFLDFSTLENRRHFCHEEVRLNRRLAPRVYHGVVPVTCTPTGVEVEGRGQVVEWAVKMERLPDDATLQNRLKRGEVNLSLVEALAVRVASFHAQADAGERITAFGRFEVVAQNVRENFEQAVPQVGTTISRAVFDRLRALTEENLSRLQPLIEERAAQGIPRDTHGDLHLDHVYLFPDRQPPDDLVIIDCIEFNQRFRYADPVADMAFSVMDFAFQGRRDLASIFTQAYFQVSRDREGRDLLPFYTAYRAAVRGKVEGLELVEQEIPLIERATALARARAHWLLALGELEKPGWRPCLVLIGGLPGTGKSTLARNLAERATFCLIRSDVVRKEQAGLSSGEPARSSFREGIYAPALTERTYQECWRRAELLLFEGNRVIVDASFGDERKRWEFLELATRLAIPAVFVLCQAEQEEIRLRLAGRQQDASDADWTVFQNAAENWEDIGPHTRPALHRVTTSGTSSQTLSLAEERLRELSLMD